MIIIIDISLSDMDKKMIITNNNFNIKIYKYLKLKLFYINILNN